MKFLTKLSYISFCLFTLFAACAIIGCSGGGGDSSSVDSTSHGGYRVGAHYYTWFPQKFREGTLRPKLLPSQEPELGIYNSEDLSVVEQHISWASQYGISFFTLPWSPSNTEFNGVISNTFLKAKNISDIEFCIFYGAADLGTIQDGVSVITEASKAKFKSDLNYFADNFFNHRQYLKVNGRPVLILYVTRVLTGDYAAMFKEAREQLTQRGIDIFFLADEIFWSVTAHREGSDPTPQITNEPQSDRMKLFDGIFAYNMYEGAFLQDQGYGSESKFIDDIDSLYKRYKSKLPSSVQFVPYAMPGYNDRGVRLSADHFAIPREFKPGTGETSFFRQFINRLVYPYVDSRNNLVLITSWNEWSEDTAIEPVTAAPATIKDKSSTGEKLTQGYAYSGYGTAYLQAVKDAFQ